MPPPSFPGIKQGSRGTTQVGNFTRFQPNGFEDGDAGSRGAGGPDQFLLLRKVHDERPGGLHGISAQGVRRVGADAVTQ